MQFSAYQVSKIQKCLEGSLQHSCSSTVRRRSRRMGECIHPAYAAPAPIRRRCYICQVCGCLSVSQMCLYARFCQGLRGLVLREAAPTNPEVFSELCLDSIIPCCLHKLRASPTRLWLHHKHLISVNCLCLMISARALQFGSHSPASQQANYRYQKIACICIPIFAELLAYPRQRSYH